MERKINSYSSSYLLLLRERMDFQLEWIEILNYTISKILTEKMILILNIGMNWKTHSFKLGPGTTVRLLQKPQNNGS